MAVDVPRSVVQKLMLFTALMVIAPILTFFIVQYLTGGNAIWSGGIAALVANIVLIGYVIVAFLEDSPKDDLQEKKKE